MWASSQFRLVVVSILAGYLAGCALYTDEDALQKRVSELENKVNKLEAERNSQREEATDRRQKLESCVSVDADQAFWEYVRLNGTKKAVDTYTAPQYVWDQARRRKLDKIEECKLLYGNQ